MIELALERDRMVTGGSVTNTGFVDAVLRASLWSAS